MIDLLIENPWTVAIDIIHIIKYLYKTNTSNSYTWTYKRAMSLSFKFVLTVLFTILLALPLASSWYTGLHGPGSIPDMMLQCFDNEQIPCTPLKTVAAWHDQSRNKRGIQPNPNGYPVITYSSADGDDITTFLFTLREGLVDSEEIKLVNATDVRVFVFCCLENHVEGGAGDS